MKTRPIVLIGGHLSPAQAVCEYIIRTFPDESLLFIGRKHAFAHSQTMSTEEKVMSSLCPVKLLDTPRNVWPWNWPSLFAAVLTLLFWFLVNRPKIVVCFGSYVSLPAVLASSVLGIPLIVHEQTRSLSRMNRFAARFAVNVCVNDADILIHPYEKKKKITGFPLRPSLFDPLIEAAYSIQPSFPLVLVMGGTTGAVSLNECVFPLLKELCARATVVHLTGELSYAKAKQIKKQLPEEVQKRYIAAPYSNTDTMRWLYRQANLAVTRSGANTVYELLAFDIPAVFIPLPWSQQDEQKHLAEWFVQKSGKGIVLDQKECTPDVLFTHITSCLSVGAKQKQMDSQAALSGTKAFVDVVLSS